MTMDMTLDDLRALVRDVPDFPQPGILFRDITPVLADARALQAATRLQAAAVADLRDSIDVVVGMEARGFLFGVALAVELEVGFAPARKPGKLPAEAVGVDYGLEYGADRLELHRDAFAPGARVLVVDDLLATGGTAEATAQLVRELGGEVAAFVFLIELEALAGRTRLGEGARVETLIRY